MKSGYEVSSVATEAVKIDLENDKTGCLYGCRLFIDVAEVALAAAVAIPSLFEQMPDNNSNFR